MDSASSALIAGIASLGGSLGTFRWLHNRSVKQGEQLATQAAELRAHDLQFADLKSMLGRIEASVLEVQRTLMQDSR